MDVEAEMEHTYAKNPPHHFGDNVKTKIEKIQLKSTKNEQDTMKKSKW